MIDPMVIIGRMESLGFEVEMHHKARLEGGDWVVYFEIPQHLMGDALRCPSKVQDHAPTFSSAVRAAAQRALDLSSHRGMTVI